MRREEKNTILLEMIKNFPDYFLLRYSRHQFFLRKIGEKYNMDIRKIMREKKIALLALKLASKDGRKVITIKDIEQARNYNRDKDRVEKISIEKLEKLLYSKDKKLADKVFKIIDEYRIGNGSCSDIQVRI